MSEEEEYTRELKTEYFRGKRDGMLTAILFWALSLVAGYIFKTGWWFG